MERRALSKTRIGGQPLACNAGTAICTYPLRGGTALNRALGAGGFCTSAFKAIDIGNGDPYVLTAGHCLDATKNHPTLEWPNDWYSVLFNGTWAETEAQYKFIGKGGTYEFPGHDWAKIPAVNSTFWNQEPWPSWVAYWPKTPPIIETEPPIAAINESYPIYGEGSSYVGLQVCHSGMVTGTSCGIVDELDRTEEFTGGEVMTDLTVFVGSCGESGDSGGPVFAANVALGIVSGADLDYPLCNRPIAYNEITEASADLGVRVGQAYTETFATIKGALNGTPGTATVGGSVYAGETALSNKYVNVNFSKYENGQWVYKNTAQATVTNNEYQVDGWTVGTGTWRVKTVFPAQEPFAESASGYHQFTIKDGYQLVNFNGKCADTAFSSLDNGANIWLWDCHNPATPGQTFNLVPIEGGFNYQLINRNSNRCVDVDEASQSPGKKTHQWGCVGPGYLSQTWYGQGVAGGINFVAQHSNQCLDVWESGIENGTKIDQWPCNETGAQLWTLKSVNTDPAQPEAYLTVSQVLHGEPGLVNVGGNVKIGDRDPSQYYVNVNFQREVSPGSWETIPGETLHLALDGSGHYEKNYWGVGNGKWRTRVVFPGDLPTLSQATSNYHYFEVKRGYRLKNQTSGKCLSVSGGSWSNGAPIISWTCSSSPAYGDGQVFTWEPMFAHWPYHRIRFNGSDKCAEIPGLSQSGGVQVVQWHCVAGGQGNQLWKGQGGGNYLEFLVKHSGQCLDLWGSGTSNGVKIDQWPCNGTGAQKWQLQAIDY